jgi:hypothetical protein
MELVLVRTYHADGTNGIIRCFDDAVVLDKPGLTNHVRAKAKAGLSSAKAKGAQHDRLQNSKFICYTIELPWEDNLPQRSCIPEGRYELKKRYSTRFGQHLLLVNVKDQELILIHPANDALKELRGCIAPVSILTGPGKGILSRNAFQTGFHCFRGPATDNCFFNYSIKSKWISKQELKRPLQSSLRK